MLKRGQGGGHRGGGVEVRFFGEFEAIEAGVPVPVRGTKLETVLALLALHQGRPVSPDRLIAGCGETRQSPTR